MTLKDTLIRAFEDLPDGEESDSNKLIGLLRRSDWYVSPSHVPESPRAYTEAAHVIV